MPTTDVQGGCGWWRRAAKGGGACRGYRRERVIGRTSYARPAQRTSLVQRSLRAGVAGVVLLWAGLGSHPLSAQQAEWNDERSLRLVELGRLRRQEPRTDSLLTSYRASAEAFIYFLLDQEGAAQPLLLRSDQVALQLYWVAPDQSRQVILGMRSRKQLPIRDFNYYLDRFTVIQNGFEDEIVVGSGHDVRSVVHPLAPLGPATYDYRLVDSVGLRLPGRPQPVSVYELQVRPREPHRPGFVGSLFLERARGDLVRLAFTFTPSSYVDPRNERVEIVLENGLWEDRYWLPHEQRLLVRRELPELELGVGTVIRAVLSVHDYTFNEEQPAVVLAARPLVARPPTGRLESYPFEGDLLSGLERAGVSELASPEMLLELDYRKLAAAAALPGSGLPPLRVFVPGASSVFRFNRSEGLVTGLGITYQPGASATMLAAYGWGDHRPRFAVQVRPPSGSIRLDAYLNASRELAPGPLEAGLFNSLTAAALGDDFVDPYLASGAELGYTTRAARGALTWALRLERQRPASLSHGRVPLQAERAMRPVLAGERGAMVLVHGDYERELRIAPGLTGGATVELETGFWRGHGFGRASGRLQVGAHDRTGRAGATLTAGGGMARGRSAPQHLYFIGGRGTLPGYPFRAFVGERYLLAGGDCWYALAGPWLSLRLLAGAGWTGWRGEANVPVTAPESSAWQPEPAGQVRAFWGVGVALFDRLLRVDYAVPRERAAGEGRWLLSIDPRLHPLL